MEAKLFNPRKIKSNSNIHIIGKRCAGKTVLANKLLKEVIQEDDMGIIVGPCEVYLKEYIKENLPDEYNIYLAILTIIVNS